MSKSAVDRFIRGLPDCKLCGSPASFTKEGVRVHRDVVADGRGRCSQLNSNSCPQAVGLYDPSQWKLLNEVKS